MFSIFFTKSFVMDAEPRYKNGSYPLNKRLARYAETRSGKTKNSYGGDGIRSSRQTLMRFSRDSALQSKAVRLWLLVLLECYNFTLRRSGLLHLSRYFTNSRLTHIQIEPTQCVALWSRERPPGHLFLSWQTPMSVLVASFVCSRSHFKAE